MSTTQELHDLPAQYDPGQTERAIYERLGGSGRLHGARGPISPRGGDRDPFVIVMPPPNVTAVLHMGHGLNNTVQDVIIRWRRMVGDETLWVPGTDHAGIATQNIIEKQLAAEGKTKFDLGRAAFVERTIEFVEETGGEILRQLRAIGASADWNRTAYTLSPELSHAVREAFVQLYERGLIYRGHRVIHWCPRCLTSLSDEEAEHGEEQGSLYHVRYQVKPAFDTEAPHWITVATTRPETMLGDVAVAVHPDDDRYRDLIGKSGDASDRRRRDSDHRRRRRCRSRVWNRRAQDHAGARRQRFRDRKAPQPADAGNSVARRDEWKTAPTRIIACLIHSARPRPIRGARENRHDAPGARPAREHRAAHARRAALLPLRHRRRAAAVGSVVREDETARQAGAQSGSRWHDSAFCPSGGKPSTSTGSRAFATGTSRASSGGATAFPSGTAMRATR